MSNRSLRVPGSDVWPSDDISETTSNCGLQAGKVGASESGKTAANEGVYEDVMKSETLEPIGTSSPYKPAA